MIKSEPGHNERPGADENLVKALLKAYNVALRFIASWDVMV